MKQPFLLFVIIAFASFLTIDKSISAENTRSYTVTFNVNMTDADGFNPDAHTVYLTGTFTGWAEPGTGGSITMNKVENREGDLIYTTTLQLAAGQHQYKYFSDAFGSGWAGGEWPGDPNRVIIVGSDMTINNTWGIIDDQPDQFTVTFIVQDETGQAIADAIITLAGNQNNAGNYVFEDMYPGTYDYSVAREGYVTHNGQIEVVDADVTETVVLLEGTTPAYQVSFMLNMADAIAEGDVAFDPEIHEVYITGTFSGWAMPGTDDSFRLQAANGNQQWYHLELITEAGQHEYKFFLVEDEATWGIGEWAGGSNRSINVEKNKPVFNRFGDIATFSVSLDIVNEAGDPLEDAKVSINGIENDPGNHSFHYMAPGDYETMVEKSGYITHYHQFTVEDEDLALTIVMEAEEEPVYILTFVIKNEDGEYINDAIITLNDIEYDAGNYVFADLSPGNYLYSVDKDGYESYQGEAVIVDQDITEMVVLKAIETYAPDIREPEIAFYPNPVSSILYVNSPDVEIYYSTMLDMLGRIVYETTVNDYRHEINVSSLKNGIYFLRISTIHGIITQRIQVVN